MTAVPVQTARDELLRIHARDGHISPQAVLIEAKDPDSPLHSHFTWDDGEAAERYRLAEAASLIRKFRITVSTAPDRSVHIREFVNVASRQYKPVAEAMRDPVDRDVVMAQAVREFRALKAKYDALVDFDALVRAEMDGG